MEEKYQYREKIKQQILDFADYYNLPVAFRDDFNISKHNITVKWSDGEQWSFSPNAEPVLKSEQQILELGTRIDFTKVKAPKL